MPPVVNTRYGQLQGQTEDDLHVFRGVPFTAPPVGALGFLYNQALTDGDDPNTGSYGMREQVAALKWVREQISECGGDPVNITIFGESADGMSVAALLGSAEAEGLVRRAIPPSGAGRHALPPDTAEEVGQRFCAALEINTDDATALRSIPAQDMFDAHGRQDGEGSTYAYLFNQQSPAMDGALRACHGIDLPYMFGTTDLMREFVGDEPQTDQLAGFAMDAWLNFVRTGNPGTNALPGWSQYRVDQRYTTVRGPDVKTIREDREEERSIWGTDLLE